MNLTLPVLFPMSFSLRAGARAWALLAKLPRIQPRPKHWLALIAGFACVAAHAFMHNMPMPGPDPFVSSMLTQRALQNKLVDESSRKPSPPKPGTANSLPMQAAVPPRPVLVDGDISPSRIAAHYPPQHRAAAEQLFSDLLTRYRPLARSLGQSPDDLGAAVAALLAASYMVHKQTDFPDAHFPALAEQMRAALRDSPDVQALPPAQRRAMVEEAAILAMLLAGTKLAMASAPNTCQSDAIAVNMRSSARAYLERLVGADADRVVISAGGLTLRRN